MNEELNQSKRSIHDSVARRASRRGRVLLTLAALALAVAVGYAPVWGAPDKSDWPMWGGTPDRNMVSDMTGLPESWDIDTGENVRWVSQLGSQSYGNPTVADGKVFVGTNNEALYDPEQGGDRGVLIAFRESDGEFLWQMTSTKLQAGRVNDWPYQGVCSSPLVVDDRLYFVNNRGELVAVDTNGFRDGENDGPYTEEELTREVDADVIWIFDMMEEVGAFQHNMANGSPVVFGDLIYVSTGNGQDESHVNIPSPFAPDMVAVNRHTGELVWEDEPAGAKILHGQWAAASVGEVGGVMQVVMGEGDGWVRGYDVLSGEMLWEFDTNPKDSVWPRTRNNVISTPVIYDNRVFIGNGQDPEHGEGIGHFYAIDATQRGDITESGRIWHYEEIRRTISTAAIHDGILYIPDFSGFLHALDVETGEPYWVHDTFAAVWASPLVVEGRVYLGDEDGDVVVLKAGKEEEVLAEMNMGSSVYSSVVPANGSLYIGSRNQLFALQLQ